MSSPKFEYPNPFLFAGVYRELYWGKLPDDHTYTFELVSFFKATVEDQGIGKYITYAAICFEDNEEYGVRKGDMVKLHLPYATLINALVTSPIHLRKPLQDPTLQRRDLNILFTFYKKNLRSVDVLDLQVKENTSTLSKRAEELVYDSPMLEFYEEQRKRYQNDPHPGWSPHKHRKPLEEKQNGNNN